MSATNNNNNDKKSENSNNLSDRAVPRKVPNDRRLPNRINTYSTESLKAGPLPSIEECLFGIPRDVTKGFDPNDKSVYMVPLNLIRRVASQGIDDDDEQLGGSHRALAWRVLLGYLPPDRRRWPTVTERERKSYASFVEELFCVEERDLNGQELRGHHSKRHRNKTKKKQRKQQHDKETNGRTKQERREGRRRRQKSRSEEENENDPSSPSEVPRLPIKFMDENERTSFGSMESSVSVEQQDQQGKRANSQSGCEELSQTESESASDYNNNNNNNNTQNSADDTKKKLSSSDVIHDDPSKWNMSEREQKILERLTNAEAVNQLLVTRETHEWNNFLENATLLDEIRKDVNRTHPHLYFYLEPQQQLGARRYGALERILFVWAKLNKGVRYLFSPLG